MNSGDQHDDAPDWGRDNDDEPEVDQVHQDDHEHLPRQPESDGETTPEQEAYTVRTTELAESVGELWGRNDTDDEHNSDREHSDDGDDRLPWQPEGDSDTWQVQPRNLRVERPAGSAGEPPGHARARHPGAPSSSRLSEPERIARNRQSRAEWRERRRQARRSGNYRERRWGR